MSSSLNALQNSRVKYSGQGLLCVRAFLIMASISSSVSGLFRLSASFSLSFGRLYFSINLTISPRFSNFWAYSYFFIVISYNPLYIGGIDNNFSFHF